MLVVGAGISGALISEMLSDAGLHVAIIDRRGAVLGSTLASTALLQYEIDTPLIELRKKIGFSNAMRAWRRSKMALEGLAHRTRELGIVCDSTRRNSLYLAGNRLSAGELKEEGEARRSIGFETGYLNRKALRERFRLDRSAALLSFDNLAVNPRQLAGGYLRTAISRGTRLYAPDVLAEVETSSKAVEATSEHGKNFIVSAVIYASGYEVPKIINARSLKIESTWALATHPQPRSLWPEQPFIWEASEPYLYLRTTFDGRIICGGEDAPFADDDHRDALTTTKIRSIRKKMRCLLPWVNTTPAFVWSASFGSSSTGLPHIGAVPGHQRIYAAMGYGGNGITFSRLAAELLTAQLLGKSDPEADLFGWRSPPGQVVKAPT